MKALAWIDKIPKKKNKQPNFRELLRKQRCQFYKIAGDITIFPVFILVFCCYLATWQCCFGCAGLGVVLECLLVVVLAYVCVCVRSGGWPVCSPCKSCREIRTAHAATACFTLHIHYYITYLFMHGNLCLTISPQKKFAELGEALERLRNEKIKRK